MNKAEDKILKSFCPFGSQCLSFLMRDRSRWTTTGWNNGEDGGIIRLTAEIYNGLRCIVYIHIDLYGIEIPPSVNLAVPDKCVMESEWPRRSLKSVFVLVKLVIMLFINYKLDIILILVITPTYVLRLHGSSFVCV